MIRDRFSALLILFWAACALAPRVWAEEPAPALSGSVFDRNKGTPVEGVEVSVSATPAGSQASARTSADGSFQIGSLPPGRYVVRFGKEGYSESVLQDVEVRADQPGRADVRLARIPVEITPADAPASTPGVPDAFLGVEEIEVTGTAVDQDASRDQADQQIDTMSADQFSDFSIPDVAAGLRFVPGVSVVDGQFAVIRGLDDRYNSTLFNSAPIPSPDPDSQSVQLDLFPTDVVSNLVISKTFAPDLPSNSSGGSLNIITNGESDSEFEFKLSAGTGINENAADRYMEFEGGSPMGKEGDDSDVVEQEYGLSLHGSDEFLGRELRFKGVTTWEVDFGSKLGSQENREPERTERRGGQIVDSGGFSTGELDLSGGLFDLTESERAEQGSAYFGLGMGLDEDSNHNLDASVFFTQKTQETVQLKEDGYIPGFDYGVFAEAQANGDEISRSEFDDFATNSAWIARKIRGDAGDGPSRGALWSTNFAESKSFERDRDLLVNQLNGDHWIQGIEGLHVGWAANHARTGQDDDSRGTRFFYEPDDVTQIPEQVPPSVESLGAGQFAATSGLVLSANDIEETQNFLRLDADWETEVSSALILKLNAGGFYEDADRDVDSSFLTSSTVNGASQFAILEDTPLELGKGLFDELDRSGGPGSDPAGLQNTTNDSKRDIRAWNFGFKATAWEQLDVLGGYRFEEIEIESNNDPFTGQLAFDGTDGIFPSKWLYFDRLDNPARGEGPISTSFNDELVGNDVPVDPVTGLVDLKSREEIESLINGKIDERRTLPSLAFTYRPVWEPLLGLTLRGAFSQTVARPSFREMGYYVSIEPGSDDRIIGNPQLGLSDVESWDTRVEYTWNDTDLVAVSLFRKSIDDPIESLVIRDPTILDATSSALYRTFFNNPNEASLDGVELEARKNLGFIGPELASFFTLGGNVTYIDAEVARIDAELERASGFFGVVPGDPARFSKLESSRRLFGQPEWIANLNLSFEHPDWGTNLTLAFYAISDVLDAAGSASIGADGTIASLVPDRYIDEYNQLDLVLSQTWKGFTFKLSAKNLTDSQRRVIYDPDQTRSTVEERSYRLGRDLSLSVSYPF